MGSSAFTALKDLKAIEADPANPLFGSAEGYLTNKAGDVILQAPLGKDTGIVRVPEGITGLEKGVFARFDEATEFFLPDSLIRLGEDVFPRGCRIGLPGPGPLQRRVKGHGILQGKWHSL